MSASLNVHVLNTGNKYLGSWCLNNKKTEHAGAHAVKIKLKEKHRLINDFH